MREPLLCLAILHQVSKQEAKMIFCRGLDTRDMHYARHNNQSFIYRVWSQSNKACEMKGDLDNEMAWNSANFCDFLVHIMRNKKLGVKSMALLGVFVSTYFESLYFLKTLSEYLIYIDELVNGSIGNR